jgi:hypothetical protein
VPVEAQGLAERDVLDDLAEPLERRAGAGRDRQSTEVGDVRVVAVRARRAVNTVRNFTASLSSGQGSENCGEKGPRSR